MPPPPTLLRHAVASATTFTADDQSATGSWSSIIGIVVALVGNVLISIALNTQRYAHIRLSEERERSRGQQKPRRRVDSGGQAQYGTSASRQGDARNVADNGKSRASSTADGETAPLLRQSDQKTSEGEEDYVDGGESKDKSYLSSPWWWLGITLMVVGECGNFLAYGFAPASIVSPLGVVALISNCLIAPWMLHESFRKRDALGVLIAVGGCVVVVLSASGDNPKLDADKIWDLISTWEFETYFGITLFLIVVLMAASTRYGDKSILIDLGLVGLFGGYTALSTKGVASLLSNTIWRIVTFPVTYLLVAVLVSTAIMQIKYVNRALQRFDSTQVIPTQFVMFTISVIIGSAILYRDFERRTPADALKFFAGCALTFFGVYCITSGRSKGRESDEEEDLSSEEGERMDLRSEDHQPETVDRASSSDRPTVIPQLPMRSHSSRSDTPALRLITHDEDDEDEDSQASNLLVENPWKGARAPGVSAAIHHSPSRPPPSPRSPDSKRQRMPMHATTSDPILPTSTLSEPSPNIGRGKSLQSPLLSRPSHERPRTPENASPLLEPGSAATARFGSVGRHSIADMFPDLGPLTNPLSNSLSAVIADSLRRGVDSVPSGSLRRRSIRRKRSKRLSEDHPFGRSLPNESLVEPPRMAPRSESHNLGGLGDQRGGLGRRISSLFRGNSSSHEGDHQ